MIGFKRPDSSDCPGYLVLSGKDRPSIVVLQEWWGLNQQIRSVAERFAAAGYNALVPDLYKGRIAQDADEASHLMNGLDFHGATFQDILGAVTYLRSAGNGKVAVMGFCMGGALTVASAVHLPEIDAAVCFYGIPPKEFADPANIRVPFQGHFATRDTWCTPEAVAGLNAAMESQCWMPEIYHYEADHAFFNKQRPEVYNDQAAELAWSRTLDYLARTL